MGRSAIHDRLLARNVIHRFHPAMFRICQSRLNVVVSFLGVQSAQGLRVGRPEHRLSAPVHRHGHPPEGHLPPGHGRAPLPGQFAQTALGPGQSADASAASTVQSSVVHHSAAFRQTRRQGNPFHPVISTPPLFSPTQSEKGKFASSLFSQGISNSNSRIEKVVSNCAKSEFHRFLDVSSIRRPYE